MQDAVERELGLSPVAAFVHFLLYVLEFDCANGGMIHSRASVDFTADGRTESTEIEYTVVNSFEMAYGRQGDRAPWFRRRHAMRTTPILRSFDRRFPTA
jgi:hypothetical protein